MISDTPVVPEMLQGVERRIIQDGDVQLVVPPTLSLTAEVTSTLLNTQFAGPVLRQSGMLFLNTSRTNQAGVNTPIFTLAKGLWRLEFDIAVSFNWATAVAAFTGAAVVGTYQSGQVLVFWSRLASIGSFTDHRTYKVLLNANMIIGQSIDVTGVGQSTDFTLSCYADRML